VTTVAQNHSELDALLLRVKEQIKACELTEAILVDDKLVTELTDTQWIQAVTKLRAEDIATFDKLKKLYQDAGSQNIEELPAEAIWDTAVDLVAASTSAATVIIIKEKRYKEAALNNLVALLQDVGLAATCHTSVTADHPPRTGKLYFLDYRMQGNDQTAGLDASRLLRDLVKREGDTPPSAVLMSRGVNDHPTQPEWEQVARNAGYYRFNFRYLDKAKVETGKMAFLFFLHELLESYPIGKEYYAQLQRLKDAAQAAANAAFSDIRQLNPSEFGIYAGMFLSDDTGRKASRHLLELFLGLLDAAVKDNEALEASFRAFAKMLALKPMLAMKDKDTHALHQLHTRLLYDRSKWVMTSPVIFGDMYRKESEPNVFYLVITPECDLELRFKNDVWLPKANEILLLRGRLTEQPTEKHPEDYVGMPFVSENKSQWIRWQLREALFVAAKALVPSTPPAGSDPNGYLKWGRLRHTEAEMVQQEYASDLVAVGIDDISGMTQPLRIEFWHAQGQDHQQLDSLVIVQTVNLKDEKNHFWAFGEDCELLLCPEEAGDQFFPFMELVELRKPIPKKTFLEKCKKRHLQFIESEGEPLMFVRSRQNLQKGWKPKRPAKEQPPSSDQPPPDGSLPMDAPPSDMEQVTSAQPPANVQQEPRGKGQEGQEGGEQRSKWVEKSKVKFTDLGSGLPTDEKK
jgi:hypothetical protein